ncbi:hypothetical protein [Anaerolinea sp.]|uniref:hypothetical protein n=1 Tax=Anaerolinea sp. TaxID=1872519 RepID=UPI002ACD58AB|nr:hypothetical protein [Anaerolinea sp.]
MANVQVSRRTGGSHLQSYVRAEGSVIRTRRRDCRAGLNADKGTTGTGRVNLHG